MATRPTDDELLTAVRYGGNRNITAVVAGQLRQKHGADLKTAWVRARLLHLESQGKVARIDPRPYIVQHRWSAT